MTARPTLRDTATCGDAAAVISSTHCPVLWLEDGEGNPVGLVTEEDIRLGLAGRSRPHHPITTLRREASEAIAAGTERLARPSRALLMAGGRGSRLAPLTDTTPKPLLSVRGQPLLHRLLGQVRAAGISHCYLSVHYLADKVRESIGDGSRFGIRVDYVEERQPLGTAGALGLLPEDPDPILVMNGDILSDINLVALFGWHARHGNQVTVATHLHEVYVPYGLAHYSDQRLERLEEKPTLRLPVNAGIYLFDGERLRDVPHERPHDMVAWLNELSAQGVAGHFPIVEPWHDIGSPEEYQRLSAE